MALAIDSKLTRGRQLRMDGTVVETTIHHPTDSRLLADSVRVLGRSLAQAIRAADSGQATISPKVVQAMVYAATGWEIARKLDSDMKKFTLSQDKSRYTIAGPKTTANELVNWGGKEGA